MKIEADDKIDFHNVLIRPKRSTINKGRSEVDTLCVHFIFQTSCYEDSNLEIKVKKIMETKNIGQVFLLFQQIVDTTGTFEVLHTPET